MRPVVGINLLWLVPGVVGGSEEYTLRLLRAVSDRAASRGWSSPGGSGAESPIEFRLYATDALVDAHPDLIDRFPITLAPNGGPAKFSRIALEHSWLAAASAGDDLLHHGGGVVPLVRTRPTVVTIHDLQPLELPQHFSPAKRHWLGTMIPRSVRAARLVITPSRFTADRISDRFGVSPDRLAVVAQGLDGVQPGPADPADADRIRQRFGRFLLLPAIAYPHKRHVDLVRVLAELADSHPDITVVMTGRPGPEMAAIDELANRLGVSTRVHHLGRVPDGELDALYRCAAALVFPSAYEGFGNPLLEALARGCPAITSDIPPLAEIGGEAALRAPVGDVPALAAAVTGVLDNTAVRDRLATAGPARVAGFSADAAARQLLAGYRRALAVGA